MTAGYAAATRCEAAKGALDIRVKHALLRIGAVGLASGVTAVVLFGLGRLILIGDLGIALPSFSQTAATSTPPGRPTASPVVLSDIATPNPTVTPSPSPVPTESAAPAPAVLALTGFRFGGRSYAGIGVADVGRSFVAPFAGTVEIRTYQFIDGEVRLGSNVPSLAFYPYVSVVAADRKITYRPGMLGSVTELLVRDGSPVAAGDRLFQLIAPGRSSWATFYNSSATYEVVVSLQAVPSGRDLDATPYFAGS